MFGIQGRLGSARASLHDFANWRSRARLAIMSVIAVAILARVASAFYMGDGISVLPGTFDQVSYDMLARRVLGGYGFTFPQDWWPLTRAGEPTAHWSFLYTLYLSGVYAVFGQHPLIARLIQAIIAGILQPWLTWRIANRTFGKDVGLIAAILVSLYSYFIYYASSLMTETYFILTILWMIDLATGMVQGQSSQLLAQRSHRLVTLKTVTPWLLLGMALGLATLLRQVILLFVPFLFGWMLLVFAKQQTGGKANRGKGFWLSLFMGMIITISVLLAVIAPWTIRNYQAFGRFVVLNTNSGYAFFLANHPIHGTNFIPILPTEVYQNLIPEDLRGLDEAALDQALLREGLDFVVQDPQRYLFLSLSRIPDYFEFFPSAESGSISNIARVFSFGILLPFMLFGLFLSASQLHKHALDGQGSTVWLLYVFIIVYSLIHVLSWALVRYRLPVDAVLVVFAAFSLQSILHWAARVRISGILKSAE